MQIHTEPYPSINAMVIRIADQGMSFAFAVGLDQKEQIVATLISGFLEAEDAKIAYDQLKARQAQEQGTHSPDSEVMNGNHDQPSADNG